MVTLVKGEDSIAFADLSPRRQSGLRKAKAKLRSSHAPYSKSEHSVGATVLVVLPDGRARWYSSPNVEVKPRGGNCAEDGAVQMTFANEHAVFAKEIFVIDQCGDGSPTSEVPYPCPVSRGAIVELALASGLREDFPVIMSTTNFDKVVVTDIGTLLPHGFDFP